jgi:RNA polymerase sigma-70 factor (ECF subfamily)
MADWVESLTAEADRAYLVALRALGDPALAEDAVQEAYARLLRGPLPDLLPGQRWAYWLKTVHGTAVNLAKSSAARRRREEEYVMVAQQTASTPDQEMVSAELARAVRVVLAALPVDERQAVSLCCEQGLTHREAAEILDIPERTVSDWVNRGLDKLRQMLVAGGFAAGTPAALSTMLGALGVPPAPATLTGKLTVLVAAARPAAAAGSVVKGGLLVKIGLGMAAAGLVAGGVLWTVGGTSGEPAPSPEQPKSKFATPVTDPGTRWVREAAPYLGSGLTSDCLDGPRLEMRTRAGPSRGRWFESGNDFTLRAYNPANERYYTIGGRALGIMDGPLSRARFGGVGYMKEHACAGSPDGRFLYFTEPDGGGLLRVIDYEKQTVTTLSKDLRFTSMTADREGRLWGLKGRGDSVAIVSPEGKVVEEKKLSMAGGGDVGALFTSFMNVALDEKRNRLYASNRATGEWNIWYWDLANGGKFVGVLMSHRNKDNTPLRAVNETGPFKGTTQRCPGGITFGPPAHNPDNRWLYQGGGDNTTFYLLDLEKEVISSFGPVDPSERKPYKNLGWVQTKELPMNSVSRWCGTPSYDEDGNVYLGIGLGGVVIRFTRVK